MLDVCLLGTGGMQPLPGRRLSAMLLRLSGTLVLIDCGEGTQVAIRECGWGLRHINTILLTHMHADHVLGLPGLLLTLANSGKGEGETLTIYGPAPLMSVVQSLLVVAPHLPYHLDVVQLDGGESSPLAGTPGMIMGCVALQHDIPCLAYALHLPRAPRFDVARASARGVPVPLWHKLQRGEPVDVAGQTIQPDDVRGDERRGLRLVLATDTCLIPALTEFVSADGVGADLLIADGMYGDDDNKPTRWQPQHMTFAEAAALARDGDARLLWLTHFSPSVSDPAAYLDRATAIFPATTIGQDGLTTTLKFED